MDRDKLTILFFSIFTNIGYSLILYSIKSFGYSDIYYTYFLSVFYLSSLLSALLYGNIEINEKNYVFYNFLGMFATLISIFFLYNPDRFINIILSTVFSYLIGSATSFSIIRYKKDVGLYYYFTLYGLFGYLIAQALLFSNLGFNMIVLMSFFSFFIVNIILFSFYFEKFSKFIINSIKEDYGLLGTIDRLINYVEVEEEKFSMKFVGRPTIISLINLLVGILYSLFWSVLVIKSSVYNAYYPMFLFVNSISSLFIYKFMKKTNSMLPSLVGVTLRMFSVVILLYMLIKGIDSLSLYFVLYMLAGVSWAEFSYYMDNYVLMKGGEEYGYVTFFRNLSSIVGVSLVGLIGTYFSLILSFPFFLSVMIVTLIGIRKKYII
ncbi:MAG: hypothetical protein BXU00_02080 [Candidatus Nanoclepta minutus]|uniref:Uncharacterized protein n=1 Tax=Candidatus Nanoclepta minutus TaxID=1940235 RepID=A0A397WRL2_9ARCH|nr:MAG: hypothetical protein BXU00_02080 [Candidatus Nanoclepta minutus]